MIERHVVARKNKFIVDSIDLNEEILFIKKPSFFAMGKLPFSIAEQIVIISFLFFLVLFVSFGIVGVDYTLSKYVGIFVLIIFIWNFYNLILVIKDKLILPIFFDLRTFVITSDSIYLRCFPWQKKYCRLLYNQIKYIYVKQKQREITLQKARGDEYEIDINPNLDYDYVLNLLVEKTGVEPKLY